MDPSSGASDEGADETLARLAHDLRNPLNTLSMNAELLGMELDGGDPSPEALREGLAAIERAVGELGRGLDELEARVHPGAPDPSPSGRG